MKQACYLHGYMSFLSFLDETLKPLEILAFDISHSSGLISTQFFSVCTSPWCVSSPGLHFYFQVLISLELYIDFL